MYTNISIKIKQLAKAIAVAGMIVSVLLGLGTMVILSIANTFIIGLIVMVIGALLSIITSWILYGFGELIEQTKKTAEYTELLLKSNPTASGFADDDDD